MIAGRADGREVNDLVTVRPLTRPGTSPRWVAEQTFGVWLGWGAGAFAFSSAMFSHPPTEVFNGGNSTTASGGQDPSADPRRRQPAGQPGVRPRYGGKVHQAGPSPGKPSFRGSIGTRWPVGGALEVGRVSCEGQLFRRSTRSRDSPAAPPGWSDSSASAKRVAGKAVLRAAQIRHADVVQRRHRRVGCETRSKSAAACCGRGSCAVGWRQAPISACLTVERRRGA
jgi:hypothetical protein